jgi:hypothetical protein
MGEVDKEPAALASTDPSLPIQKKVLHAGRGDLPEYKDGTKVCIFRNRHLVTIIIFF